VTAPLPELRPVADHEAAVLDGAQPLPGVRLSLLEAAGLVLAEDVTAAWPLPSFDNSSMDGYAVVTADVALASTDSPITLPVLGDIAAGQAGREAVAPGTTVRIMTGAPVPPGADAVIPVEWTDGGVESVVISKAPDVGAHIRRTGEDVEAGRVVVEAGTVLTSRVIAMLAAVGCSDVLVHRRPVVTVISTGDELVDPGTPPGEGQIVDSNSYMLVAAAREAGAEVVRVGPIPDDDDRMRQVLDEAGATSDVILTSRGVSMGAYDTVKAVLIDRGGVDFVKVAMQPGMPQGCGRVGDARIVTLPGNPVSSYVSFEVFVRPLLRRLLGHTSIDRPRIHAICDRDFTSPAKKTQFARVRLSRRDGLQYAEPEGGQGSHIIGGLSRADGLAIIPPGVTSVRAGDELVVIDLAGEGS